MSATYNLEPQPTARVILQTTLGDLSLELFGKQAPLATRNFIQLCLDGYYNNTIFHRLVPGFILQGGDPTGNGSGGQSSYDGGKPFKDEFHSRLKFNRRGLLGMANGGSKNENGSQFFLTLGRADELQNKHTLFGRIHDHTIYNLIKIGESELTPGIGSDRPLYPTKIIACDIIVNPFDDLTKRPSSAGTRDPDALPADRKRIKKIKRTKKALLSFDDRHDEDNLINVDRANPNLIKVESNAFTVENKPIRKVNTVDVPAQEETQIPASTRQNRSPERRAITPASTSPSLNNWADEDTKERDTLKDTVAHIAGLKASMKRKPPPTEGAQPQKRSVLQTSILGTTSAGRSQGRSRGRSTVSQTADEQRSVDAFEAFRSRLKAASTSNTSRDSPKLATHSSLVHDPRTESRSNGDAHEAVHRMPDGGTPDDAESILCDLHFIPRCGSCAVHDRDNSGDEDEDMAGKVWMSHRLTFETDRRGKDLEWKRQNENLLEVIDPRVKTEQYASRLQQRE